MRKNDAFVAKIVNTRLTKGFMAIFAPAESLPSPATLRISFLSLELWMKLRKKAPAPIIQVLFTGPNNAIFYWGLKYLAFWKRCKNTELVKIIVLHGIFYKTIGDIWILITSCAPESRKHYTSQCNCVYSCSVPVLFNACMICLL